MLLGMETHTDIGLRSQLGVLVECWLKKVKMIGDHEIEECNNECV